MSIPTTVGAPSLENPNTVGAGYANALLSGDEEMQACFRQAFTAEQLLDALSTQVLVMGRRLARRNSVTPTQVGDALVYAAKILESHDLLNQLGGTA